LNGKHNRGCNLEDDFKNAGHLRHGGWPGGSVGICRAIGHSGTRKLFCWWHPRHRPGTFDAKKPLDSAGQTYHGDHASVFYQIPENPHKYPIVMLHGAGQFSRTWESTPDGREGFQNIFLRRGFSTYLVDQPRRGSAGRTTVEGTVTPKPDEQMWFNQFRVGVWPEYFKGVQFSHDKEALNQYFRQMTPNTGPFDINVISDAMSAVVDKSGPAILFTHSQGGGPGWYTAMKNDKVKAIVAFEPGSSFVFPEKELPAPMPSVRHAEG
jgi:pimeloyl-ACP methyl ester carboxylesterase